MSSNQSTCSISIFAKYSHCCKLDQIMEWNPLKVRTFWDAHSSLTQIFRKASFLFCLQTRHVNKQDFTINNFYRPYFQDLVQIFWIMTTLPPSMNTVLQLLTPTTNPTRLSECATENSFALPFLFTILRLWTRLWPRRLHQTQPQHIIGKLLINNYIQTGLLMTEVFELTNAISKNWN